MQQLFERRIKLKLLKLNSCASLSKLSLDSLSVFLGSAFLEGLRSAFDDVLGFLQAQARNDLADGLDDGDLLGGSITKEDWVYVYVPDDDLYGWLCSSFLTSKQAFSQEITDSVSEEYSQNTDIMDTTA